MYNPEQKQVIVKNSLGVSYHIFYESGRGLCVRMLGDSGIWSRGYVLSDEAVNDFSVILDKDDIFHFVFQSKDGRILYGHGRHGQIDIQTVLESRDTTPWMKHVCLIAHQDRILLFYLVRYQKKYLLSMQTVRNGAFMKPVAIDYTDGPGKNYQVLVDGSRKCRLFYTSNDGAVKRLIQRLYNEDTGLFSAPEKLISIEHEVLLCAAAAGKNQIQLLYQVSSENLYQLFYREADTESASICLYKASSPPGHAGLVYHGGLLRCFRISSDCIYARASGDEGETWTDEALFPFGTGTSLTCFTYFTNHAKEQGASCVELPGTFSKGYQLAFVQNEASTGFPGDLYPASPGPRSASSHDAREQKANDKKPDGDIRNELPDGTALKEVQKKVLLLQNLTENMQRELTKLWLAQKGHENKLSRLERFYDQQKRERFVEADEVSVQRQAEPTSDRTAQKFNGMGNTAVAAITEREEDFYDDDIRDSDEEDVEAWFREEKMPGIVQEDFG